MSSETPTEFREYLGILRTRKLGISLITLIVVSVALVLTFRQTPVYEGEAKVLVQPLQNPLTTTIANAQLSAPDLETEKELVRSQTVAIQVQEVLATSMSTKHMLSHLTVAVIGQTDVLVIRFRDVDPVTAADLANGFADGYIEFRRQQAIDQVAQAAQSVLTRVEQLQAQLTDLNGQLPTAIGTQLATLQTQKDTLEARMIVLQQQLVNLQPGTTVAQGGGQVLARSDVPDAPVSPNKVRTGILALFAGLLLGGGFAFLRERLDDRLKDREELEHRLEAPVLAAVPKLPGWRRGQDPMLIMRTDPKSPASEAYRTLATNVQYLASLRPLKILLVTSAMGGEGKTTSASNLAIALARAGKRVVLVSADMRRPRLHHFFRLPNDVGLSDLLSEPSPATQAAQDPRIPNLRVIVGGPIPHDPAALLGSARTGEFLDALRELSDFIILDAPPVLAVADASILAPRADGTIFVMDAEHSSRSAIRHAKDQLENAGAHIIGGVYNNFDPNQGSGYASHYYYQYYADDQTTNGNGKRRRKRKRAHAHAGSATSAFEARERTDPQ